MKKLILLASLLIASLVQAQNSLPSSPVDLTNTEYIKSLNNLTIDQTHKIADEIVSSLGTKYELLKMSESEQNHNLQFEYIPVGLTATEKEDYKLTNQPLTIRFSIYYIGENKDLEIKGEKAFRLSEVRGKYLDIAPYWIKTFYPDATPETVLSNYDLKTFYKRDLHLKFMLQKNNETWKLLNVSN